MALNSRDNDSVFAATMAGLYLSEDAAQNWKYVDLNVPITFNVTGYVIVDKLEPDFIYVSCCSWGKVDRGGIARSTDGGTSWELINAGLPDDFCVSDIDISYGNDGSRRIFAGSYDGAFYSDDLGEGWNLCQGGLPPDISCFSVEVNPINSDFIFIFGEGYGLFKSTDRGQTWNNLSFPISAHVYEFACDPLNSDIAYVTLGSNYGLFKTTDGGQNWFDSNNNIPRYSDDFYLASGISINPLNSDNLFINSYHKGVFVSYDGGLNWDEFNDGLRTGYSLANSILIDPRDTCRIYLATDNYSTWSFTKTQTSIDDEISPPNAFTALSNYPNPFNVKTSIRFNLAATADIRIDIFDIRGRRLETLFQGRKEAGAYSLIWDASDYPSGVYFTRLKTANATENIKMVLLK